MGKKIFSVVVLVLAAYGAWQAVKDTKAYIQKKKVSMAPPVVKSPAV